MELENFEIWLQQANNPQKEWKNIIEEMLKTTYQNIDEIKNNNIDMSLNQFWGVLKDFYNTSLQKISHWNKDEEWVSHIKKEFETKYNDHEKNIIDNVIAQWEQYLGTKYLFWGTNKKWIDCSWFISVCFNNTAHKFWGKTSEFGRLSASIFDTKSPDIDVDRVERWDFMFWEAPEWVKKWWVNEKWEHIYHIELVVGVPFEKDGKMYVKTLWSSTDKWILNTDWEPTNRNGVWYRLREYRPDKHHFAHPPYFEEIANIEDSQNAATWSVIV